MATPPNMRQVAADDDYAYVVVEDDSASAGRQDGGGINGCLLGLLGTGGCLALVVLLIGGIVLVSGMTLQSMWNSLPRPNISGWLDNTQGVAVPDNIYVPPVERIRALSELSTVKYSYSEVITAEVEMPDLLARLYGNSQVLVAVGNIRAGIDTSLITQEDIILDATTNTLNVTLPAPMLQDCFLDETETYVAERNSAAFAPDAPQLDTESRRFALEQFRDRALEEGILTEAAQEAEAVMTEFLQIVTDDNVTVQVVTAPPDPNAPLPETCG